MAELNDPYLTILELLRRYQVKNRFLVTAYASQLGTTDSHILAEIASGSEIYSKDLVPLLLLEKSSLSRALKGLKKQQLIAGKRAANDARLEKLTITPRGHTVLNRINQVMDQSFKNRTKDFDQKDLALLRDYLMRFADGDGAPKLTLSKGLHPIMVEIRRLTRVCGVIGPSFLGTDFSSSQWQVLSELERAHGELVILALSNRLDLSSTTVSSMVKRLSKLGLVRTVSAPFDRRCTLVALTTKGREALAKIRIVGQERFKKALRAFRSEELQQFINLLAKFAGEPLNEDGRLPRDNIEISLVIDPEERSVARAFVIENLVRANRHLDAPELLLGAKSICYTLRLEGELCAVFEFQLVGKRWMATTVVGSEPAEKDAVMFLFFKEVLKRLRSEHSVHEVNVPENSPVIGWTDGMRQLAGGNHAIDLRTVN